MDTEIYKVIPFSEVAIGQEFEEEGNARITARPWIKIDGSAAKINRGLFTGQFSLSENCLVRISDCETRLDFDTWWDREGADKMKHTMVKELCRIAWENGQNKQQQQTK